MAVGVTSTRGVVATVLATEPGFVVVSVTATRTSTTTGSTTGSTAVAMAPTFPGRQWTMAKDVFIK